MDIFTIIAIIFLGYTINSYRNKDFELISKSLHFIGVLIIVLRFGLTCDGFIINIFTDPTDLFKANFVDVRIFNRYLVFLIWMIYISLNFLLIVYTFGIANLLRKSVLRFNKVLPVYVLIETLSTSFYFLRSGGKEFEITQGLPEYFVLIFVSIYYIALYTIVYYLLNNKYVNEMYKEGSLLNENE